MLRFMRVLLFLFLTIHGEKNYLKCINVNRAIPAKVWNIYEYRDGFYVIQI